MKEGNLQAPKREPAAWRSPGYYDEAALDAELRRVFDICHTCRLCFSLCGSFPRLFDLIDGAGDAELAGVDSSEFKQVADQCTLCDICFMGKCPYVPPHEFNIDFPQLMVRYRAVEHRKGLRPRFIESLLSHTDRNGRWGTRFAALANWAMGHSSATSPRGRVKAALGIDPRAAIPNFSARTLIDRVRRDTTVVNSNAPAFGRKAVIYATCYGNYHSPEIGIALRRVLAHNGVETEILYSGCCAMPLLEQGDLEGVAAAARRVSAVLVPWVQQGYAVVGLLPSCVLMLKSQWPLLVPEDGNVAAVAAATRDAAEYVVEIAKAEGLAAGLSPLQRGITLHVACHARAQNMGRKAAEMLRLIPEVELQVIERCSGHGGAWGVLQDNFATAAKLARPVARQAGEAQDSVVSSECPLAGSHILQCMENLSREAGAPPFSAPHPIELFAQSYGMGEWPSSPSALSP